MNVVTRQAIIKASTAIIKAIDEQGATHTSHAHDVAKALAAWAENENPAMEDWLLDQLYDRADKC